VLVRVLADDIPKHACNAPVLQSFETIWPAAEEVQEVIDKFVNRDLYRNRRKIAVALRASPAAAH